MTGRISEDWESVTDDLKQRAARINTLQFHFLFQILYFEIRPAVTIRRRKTDCLHNVWEAETTPWHHSRLWHKRSCDLTEISMALCACDIYNMPVCCCHVNQLGRTDWWTGSYSSLQKQQTKISWQFSVFRLDRLTEAQLMGSGINIELYFSSHLTQSQHRWQFSGVSTSHTWAVDWNSSPLLWTLLTHHHVSR